MKKSLLTFAIIFIIALNHAFSQCSIDSTQTIPGVYPDTAADGIAFHPYSQDMTFVMILDTLGFTISNYEIVNISGLPAGITWICNNFANGCNYDPTVNLYGCVNISGTPLVPGTYIANVNVIATVSTLGDQSINYYFPFTVLPDTVSNAGFSMTNSTGCAPLTVGFTNNIPGQAAYLWDFNNGVNDTTENPPAQLYTTPGDFVVTQTITPAAPPQFFLTEITVNSVPDNYNEFGILDPDPDLYFVLSDTAGNTIYDSRPATNNTQPPYTWTVPNIALLDQNYSLQVWDQDSLIVSLGDDDLGIITFAGWGNSGTDTATVAGATGQLDLAYTIFQIPVTPVVYSDTVHVFASPAVPIVTPSGPLTFCDGDSVILTSSASDFNQWYDSTTVLTGDTSQALFVYTSGYYQVIVTIANGCSSSSAITQVIVNPLPPKPTIYTIADTIYCALSGYNLQWYLNGTIINGATGQFYIPLVSGTYSVVATDPNGCSKSSDPLLFQGVGITDNNFLLTNPEINPNPSDGHFNVEFEADVITDFSITITDVSGRKIYIEQFKSVSGRQNLKLDLSGIPKGIYFFDLSSKGFQYRKTLVISD